MTCCELVELLSEYLDGRLAPRRRTTVDEHLARCDRCRAYLATFRRTIRLAKQVWHDDSTAASVPESLVRSILRGRTAASYGLE